MCIFFLAADIFKGSSSVMRPSINDSSYSMSLVNLGKLDDVSLKRYRRVFQLDEPYDTEAEISKEELILAVSRHFTTQVREHRPHLLFLFASASCFSLDKNFCCCRSCSCSLCNLQGQVKQYITRRPCLFVTSR